MGTHRVGSGSLILGIILSTMGCASHAPVSAPPPCPVFDSNAIADYVRILQWEETQQIDQVDALHGWMEDQITFCKGIDAYRKALD